MDRHFRSAQASISFPFELREAIEQLRDELAIGGRRPSLANVTRALLERGIQSVRSDAPDQRPRL